MELVELPYGLKWLVLFAFISMRYFILAGIAFGIFYGIKKRAWEYKRIQAIFPKGKDYLREVAYSCLTFMIFATGAAFLFTPSLLPYTKLYFGNEYGMGYFVCSFGIMLLLHDTYFYWMHRLMHRPKLFKPVHLVHHKSTNPSPWAAFAFHPLEAILEFGIIFLLIFIIPVHRNAFILFLISMTAYNVYGHLGYELYPKNFQRHWLGKWINTSVNHNMHHKYFKGNYGLYFTFWDRIMGTLHPNYDNFYDQVQKRKSSPPPDLGKAINV